MSVIEDAVKFALEIAEDPAHGYDQANRWGPDYDCSSLVISCFKRAGLPLRCTYTGNMYDDMLNNGFLDFVKQVNLSTGMGLERGDVLLNNKSHTALYIGGGQVVQASCNEKGEIVGGLSGDQNGREIAIGYYYNYPWDHVLRYIDDDKSKNPEQTSGDIYIVKPHDTLWGLADRFYKNGSLYYKIMAANNLSGAMIYEGQVLKIPPLNEEITLDPAPIKETVCQPTLPILRYGDSSMAVRKVQAVLKEIGYDVTTDGDFGPETKQKVMLYQTAVGVPETGEVDALTWSKLMS